MGNEEKEKRKKREKGKIELDFLVQSAPSGHQSITGRAPPVVPPVHK
jgi:hypothetical protein